MTRTLVASDNFNRANGAIGANWQYSRLTSWQATPPSIKSNVVLGLAGGANFQTARWVGAGTFTADQYAKGTVNGLTYQSNYYRVGVTVRDSGDVDAGADCYFVQVFADGPGPNYTTLVGKIVNGTVTTLDSTSRPWVNGDTVELEAEGSTLRALRNGSVFFTTTDTSIATGKPGITVAGDNALTFSIDNWEGGVLSSAPAVNLTGANASFGLTSGTATVTVVPGGASGTVTSDEFRNFSNILQTGVTVPYVAFLSMSGALVLTLTGQVTNGAGKLVVSNAALVPGTSYMMATWDTSDPNADTMKRGFKKVTAA
jgi:hypothetical protein